MSSKLSKISLTRAAYIVVTNTMGYTIEQKIGKHIYIYEVQSYWDPVKKQPRQKRRYIGKKDVTTGEIITPRKGFTPRACRDYGDVYLLRMLSDNIGLTKTLKAAFPKMVDLIVDLACFQIIEKSPLYLFRYFLESHQSKIPPEDGTSQRLSELMEQLGKMDRERERFFRLWLSELKGIKAIIFDITSLSSYSRLNDFMEWGYNRDGDRLPQVNLGVVFTRPLDLPLAYSIYPGSIPDVSTLGKVMEFLIDIGMKEMFFVLDRGFFSEHNIQDMADRGIGFVIPISNTTRLSRAIISKSSRTIMRPANAFTFQDRGMFHTYLPVSMKGLELCAHIYFDERRRADEVDNLIRRLTELEEKIRNRGIIKRKGLNENMEGVWKGSSKFFSISINKGQIELKRKEKAISRLMNRMGYTVLLTNDTTYTRDELLLMYRKRDFIERLFDVLKNELNENRLRVTTRVSMEGRIFLIFISLILYAALDRRMHNNGLYKKYTVSEVLSELKKLRYVEMTRGRCYLTEVTKRQRILFESLEVPVPVGT